MNNQLSFIPGYEYEPPEPRIGSLPYKKPKEEYGPGPEGMTCKRCAHCLKIRYHDRIYYKCAEWIMSHSSATDIRMKWDACGRFEAKPGAKPDQMNLYWVTPNNDEYGVFVFARSPGRARYMALQHGEMGSEFTALRVYTKRKDVGGPEMVIACDDDPGADRVQLLGFKFTEPEEAGFWGDSL